MSVPPLPSCPEGTSHPPPSAPPLSLPARGGCGEHRRGQGTRRVVVDGASRRRAAQEPRDAAPAPPPEARMQLPQARGSEDSAPVRSLPSKLQAGTPSPEPGRGSTATPALVPPSLPGPALRGATCGRVPASPWGRGWTGRCRPPRAAGPSPLPAPPAEEAGPRAPVPSPREC